MESKLRSLIVKALKENNELELLVYRSLLANIQNEEKKSSQHNVNVIEVLNKARKMRIDAAEQYRACNNMELAEKEYAEANIISTLLPAEPTIQEIADCVREAGTKVMGDIIKFVKSNYPTADGKQIVNVIKSQKQD